jgi:hypothetical protein
MTTTIITTILDRYVYDPSSGAISNKHTKKQVGYKHKKGYLVIGINIEGTLKTIKAHKIAWFLATGAWNENVSHINHDKTDNRLDNLRTLTNHELKFTASKSKRACLSKYKGVTWHKQDSKWFARVNFNKKQYFLGLFDSEDEAAEAYNKKAIELFGDLANLNVIP